MKNVSEHVNRPVWSDHNTKFAGLCNVTHLKTKFSLWRMFCIAVVISAWAISDLIRCSAGACCEQLFGQEKRTNNPVIRTVDLP